MPITFKCACGESLTVADDMAGKTGKCPKCGKAVQAPGKVAPSAAAPGGADGKKPSAPRPASGRQGITFKCSKCGEGLTVPVALAGKKGKCPKCGSETVAPVPKSATSPSGSGSGRIAAAMAAKPGSLKDQFGVIKFKCSCGTTLAVTKARAGKLESCVKCGKMLTVPAESM